MSFLVSSACVRLKTPGVAKNVLMALAEISNDDGYAWPSLETLCMRTCWGRSAVIEAIGWLEQYHAIQADRSNGRKTTYWVTPDSFVGERFPAPKEDRYKRRNQSASRTGAPVRQTDHTRPPAGPDPSAKRTLVTTHHEYQITPSPLAGGAPGFEAIAAGYPRRSRIEAARREWDKLAPSAELQAEIARAIQAWIPSAEWAREGGKYVPKLSGFLRDKRWLDAPAVAASPAPPPPIDPPLTREQLATNAQRAREVVARAKALFSGERAGVDREKQNVALNH